MDREQLIHLSNERRIKYKKKFIQEADEETLERISLEYEIQLLDEANDQLANLLLTKFSEFIEKMELVKDSLKLEDDLSKNDLLHKDIKNIVSHITPYAPMIGLISGGITVGAHEVDKKLSEDAGVNQKAPTTDE